MNRVWKNYLHLALGGLAIVSIVGGLLWFFITEKSSESALAIVGGLITLLGSFQTREDKKEQAQDKAKILNAIQTEKRTIPVVVDGYSSPLHREADIHLFKKLWEHLKRFNDKITWLLSNESIERSIYNEIIGSYIELRARKENSFIHKGIEETFKILDNKLGDFESKRVILTGTNRIPLGSRNGPILIVSNYKYKRLKNANPNQSYADFNRIADEMGEEWNKFREKYADIDQQIAEIVRTVKIVLPEIEFD